MHAVADATRQFASNATAFDDDRLIATISVVEGTRLMEVMRALDAAGIDAIDLNTRRATLDDVFLTLTGTKRVIEEVPA
jgi:ABC-2 type transport system ATP-binding protein